MNVIRSAFLGSIFAVGLPWLAHASTEGSRGVDESVTAIASAAMNAEYRVLVDGATEPALGADDLASHYLDGMNERFKEVLQQREFMAARGLRYGDFKTALAFDRLDVNSDTATLDATEHTFLSQVMPPGIEPPATEYYQRRRFKFRDTESGWALESHAIVEPFGPPGDGSDPLPTLGIMPSDPYETPPQPRRERQPDAALGTLNKASVVSYAYIYWNTYNPSYRDFSGSGSGGDCTNFASQAMRNGGWPDVSGWYRDPSYWWYNSLNQTWSWVNVGYWRDFTNGRRGSTLAYVSWLEPGDVLQVDFNRDGTWDHTMIVTKKIGTEVYLTYHTTNTVDRAFSDLLSSYPNANWYAWGLWSSY